jgi:hypothetical protein
METFERLFLSYYQEDNQSVPIASVKQEPQSGTITLPYLRGVLLSSREEDGKQILSQTLYSKNLTLVSIPLSHDSFARGAIGIYRHAYPKTISQDFGYLEEIRVILSTSLYTGKIRLQLCPVVCIEGDNLFYVPSNKVTVIFIDPYWVIEKDHHYYKGVSFTLSRYPIGRTSVESGQFVEYDGNMTQRSARGIIPEDFTSLFEEAYNREDIVWRNSPVSHITALAGNHMR